MKYRVHNGINYPDGQGGEHRAEIGDVVDNIPSASVSWLLEAGYITPADDEEGD